MLILEGSKLSPVCICFLNLCVVVDGSVLCCTGSGIGSVFLLVSNMLTLEWSKVFPVCICFLMLLRQWHCTCTVDCQQNFEIGWVVVALVNVVFSVHLLFNFSDVMNGLVLCCTGSGVH